MDVAICSTAALPFQTLMYVLQGALVVYLLRLPSQNIIDKGPVLFFSISILLVGAVHGFNSLTYPYKIFLIVMCYLIALKVPKHQIQETYIKIMYILAVISLIFYVLVNFVGYAGPFMEYSSAVNEGRSYSTNLLYTYLTAWPNRNGGIFHEPGAYQIYLNLALLAYYNINKTILIDKKNIIYYITIFTTLSSAGIIIAGCILCIRIIQMRKIETSGVFMLLLFAFLAYFGLQRFNDVIFYKLYAGVEESGSAFARYYSVFIPMRIMLDYPIFGCGALEFNDVISQYRALGISLTPGSITNSITTNFATSGFVVGMFYLVGWCRGIKDWCSNYGYIILVIFASLMLVSCENITYSVIFNYFIILGLSKK